MKGKCIRVAWLGGYCDVRRSRCGYNIVISIPFMTKTVAKQASDELVKTGLELRKEEVE